MTASPALQPSLDDDYALTADRVAAFRRDGHIRLPGLLSRGEVDAYRPVIAAAVDADAEAQDPKHERSEEQRLFPSVVRLWQRHAMLERFAFARRFTRTVAELLGCRSLRLYSDGSMFKQSGGLGTDWHQDGFYMPVDTDRMVTLWLALDDVSEAMGTLAFASGSQQQVQRENYSPASIAHLEREIAARGWPVVRTGDLAAGDATVHLRWTAHSVPPNRSGRRRQAFSLIYLDAEARLLDTQDPVARSMMKWNLGDQPPGSLPDEHFNPTVYRAG
jgi:hypothetical protein